MTQILQAIQQQHPNDLSIDDLEKICIQFPYFQSVRSIYLKKLFLAEHFKYNYQLKLVAAHTVDREILFDYINQITDIKLNTPPPIPKDEVIAENHIHKTVEIAISENENTITTELVINPIISAEKSNIITTTEDPSQTINAVEDQLHELATAKTPEVGTDEEIEDTIEILQKPLLFTNQEKLSFNQWLQLTNTKAIQRTEQPIQETSPEIQKKLSIIDKFIQNNPKIEPVKKNAPVINNQLDLNQEISTELMTETLAKVYISQKKYENAMQAYRILSLKYPEKSGYFADQIKQIKNLQNHKS